MSFFNYRWDKCCVLAIGGTYVYWRWDKRRWDKSRWDKRRWQKSRSISICVVDTYKHIFTKFMKYSWHLCMKRPQILGLWLCYGNVQISLFSLSLLCKVFVARSFVLDMFHSPSCINHVYLIPGLLLCTASCRN
jgi:hypothetical protein